MRLLAIFIFPVFIFLTASRLLGQERYFPPEIKKVEVGFQPYKELNPSSFKVGLWTPVHVEVFGGSEGLDQKPGNTARVILETVDNEDVGTRIGFPVTVEPMKTRSFIGYVKTGHMAQGQDVRVSLKLRNREYTPRTVDLYRSVAINHQLYVTLGSKINDLQRAVQDMGLPVEGKEADDSRDESNPRHVAYENEVDRLPEQWYGYQGVDLLFLSTNNREFINKLRNQTERLKALATWVRRGGRLVIPVAWQRQEAVADLLCNELAWQPPIPVVPPSAPANANPYTVKRLSKVEEWGGGKPFQRADPKNPQVLLPIPIAKLEPDKVTPGDWEVWADSDDGRPLIARVRYGLGQITYLAFSLEDEHFFGWNGKEKFLKTMILRLAPRAPTDWQANNRGLGVQDLTTELLGQQGLDNFDVTVIPFGYIALFIILYILVVGPLDFFLLKYVFKRMEWTWITFPTIVLSVSIIAYFAAFTLKGRDLKINKIDIVDFDLRTDVNAKRDPRSVHAYGQTFFTILSPRIQNYTVGVEPNPQFWGQAAAKVLVDGKSVDQVLGVDLMSWMGRPSGGPFDMGRSGSSGFFHQPYSFRDDAAALEGVPIPVWTTKSMTASWEQVLPTSPMQMDLVYHQKEVKGKELKITGTMANRLGVDLVDVCLLYDDRVYPLAGGLKRMQPNDRPLEVSIPAYPSSDIKSWVMQNHPPDEPSEQRNWSSNTASLVKQILFHERSDPGMSMRNHLLRPLDLGWRLLEERRDQHDRRTREAILYARVRFASGPAEDLTREQAFATNLWLGDLPEDGMRRPELHGHLNQDTYIRVILPVRPAEE